jgi:hypothetical protein
VILYDRRKKTKGSAKHALSIALCLMFIGAALSFAGGAQEGAGAAKGKAEV